MTTTPFGRMVTAMVTPMNPDGSLDIEGIKSLAKHLVDNGSDGLVVNGTTGESATTTDEENIATVKAVVEAVGDRAKITAGVGTNDTAHSVRAAKALAEAGAHAILVVTPYYNKPTQAGIIEHFKAVVGATDLPAMAYDIPGRTGMALTSDTIRELAKIENLVAMKDAKADLFAASQLMAETELLWFSGDDVLNLPWLALGAVGVVSVVGHVAGRELAELIAAMDAGDLPKARAIHTKLIPVMNALMTTSQGVITAKAALKMQGVIASDAVRLPLVTSPDSDLAIIRDGMKKAGLL